MKSNVIIDRVRALSRNLWWTWNPDAQRLFASLDPALFDATHHNPLRTLRLLTPERRELLETDPAFASHLSAVERGLRDYMTAKTWFARTNRRKPHPLIAYFCAEFAIHESFPQYSGGLGVLAGDHVKSASDLGIPLVGVGLLYGRGFYTQEFNPDGSTRVIYPQLDFADCPVTDTGKIISVPMAGKSVRAKIWLAQVGRVRLILLNTNIAHNTPADRKLTDHLYGGDREYRIRQEILLGVGGAIALETIGLHPTVYHLNEGHAAFCATHRLADCIRRGLPFAQAREQIRRSTVFTTHTPVPAGNERFAPNLTWKYLHKTASDLGLSRREFLALGRENAKNQNEEFCMTILALRLSNHCNGVAALHGDTSRKMWRSIYGLEDSVAVPIGHVTNGVHTRTWLAPEIEPLYAKHLKPDWNRPTPNGDFWSRVDRIPPRELWDMRTQLRRLMIAFIRRRLMQQALRHHATSEQIALTQQALREDALTIGFARRFATYKRAPLIFHNPNRLARILAHADRPVQLIFAGKAHPADLGGQNFARQIYKFASTSAFRGRVVILEDYDMELGRTLTAGCDVWLNNPVRPQEASGTSGMKGPLHGGINCSILDGWWPEAYNGRNGWEIGDGREFSDPRRQDRHDADSIYELLEKRIVPEFYDRDRAGMPRNWIARMRNSMKTVCPQFNTHRMLGEYWQKYYSPAHAQSTRRPITSASG